MKCRICFNEELDQVLDLGYHPPSDAFLIDLREPETFYPLNLVYCEECGLVQIDYEVPPEILFQCDYPYTTGINKGGIKHFEDLAVSVVSAFDIQEGDLVVDIGGNDGTLLNGFVKCGIKRVLNVDPCGVKPKVPTMEKFWNLPTAHFVKSKYGTAYVILATNVFAHVPDVHEFLDAVRVLLDDDGYFVVESPCLEDMLKYFQFDQIYHEHLNYYSVESMNYLVDMHDMILTNVEHNDMHGGTNRYFIEKVRR